MRSNFKLLFLIAATVAVLAVSCKNEYYKLTAEEEAEWMPYKQKDQLIFASSQGDVDTFKVLSLSKAYRDGYNEFLDAPVIKLKDTVDGNETQGGVYLYKTSAGLSVTARLPHYYLFEELTNKPLQFADVNGLSYSDVIVLASNPLYLDNDTYIDTIYYSKSFGFIKYVDINGVEWSVMN